MVDEWKDVEKFELVRGGTWAAPYNFDPEPPTLEQYRRAWDAIEEEKRERGYSPLTIRDWGITNSHIELSPQYDYKFNYGTFIKSDPIYQITKNGNYYFKNYRGTEFGPYGTKEEAEIEYKKIADSNYLTMDDVTITYR